MTIAKTLRTWLQKIGLLPHQDVFLGEMPVANFARAFIHPLTNELVAYVDRTGALVNFNGVPYAISTGALLVANNLSDVANAATALQNLNGRDLNNPVFNDNLTAFDDGQVSGGQLVKFTVGDSTTTALQIYNSVFDADTAVFGIVAQDDASVEMRLPGDQDFSLFTNGERRLSILNGGDVEITSRLLLPMTTAGTTGNQTINKQTGIVLFAAAASSLTVTNSLVTVNSGVIAMVITNDSTAVIKSCVPGDGALTINMATNPTATTKVFFAVFN